MVACKEVIDFEVKVMPEKKWELSPEGKIVKTPEYAAYLFQMRNAFKAKYDEMMVNPKTI